MAIDPSRFHLTNVVDTCAVWNVLSSVRLHSAAKEARCTFVITGFVHYECLKKPRKPDQSAAQLELVRRLIQEQRGGGFSPYSCDIEDLHAIGHLESRKQLGKGELSSIAFAMKTGQAFITDDQKARKLGEEPGHAITQTTPHLFSWLVFTGRLETSDKSTVIEQHKEMQGILAPHFQTAFELALKFRLNAYP